MKSDNALTTVSILIVDDEPKNIQLLGNLLVKQQYDIEFAMSGKQCLAWLRRKSFDLVLLDVMMPEMDGYEVCEKIKSDSGTEHIPVIFLTAKSETDDIVKAFDTGCADFVKKPFKAPELLARIKKELELKMLRGLLPICSYCKKIRDDKGYWSQIENYISTHSLMKFSHSICEECFEENFPGVRGGDAEI
ncbi:MAG: response regulator [Desulfobacterales bacterium]|nr:response regulator [Desulfobacterales bacterium]